MYQLCFFVCHLLLCIVKINGDPGQSREYYIIEGRNPSYVYRKFDNVEEEMFPKEISVQVAFSKTVGTLIYSVDKHRNQFIVTMRDDVHYETRFGLQVEFNTQWIDVSLAKLCTCERCKFDHLAAMNLRFQINDYIILQCNGGRTMKFTNQRLKKIDTNYPIMYSESDSTTGTGNEAHLWLVNHPIINNVYPNYYQMYGCIFDVTYKEKTIIFTNISTNIGSECPESCKNDMCNGGECFVRYSNESVCDCTNVFRNGPSCGDDMQRRNFKADSQSILMKMFKLSWKSEVKSIFLIKNTFVRVAITSNESSLFFEYSYSDHRNISRKEILLDNYKPNAETVCLVFFKEFSVEFRVSNNAIWKTTRIWCPSHFGNEYFHSITMRSGTGVIDIVYKSAEEYQWEKLNVINPIEIKNESSIRHTSLIFGVTIPVMILIVVAVIVISTWKIRKEKKNAILYAPIIDSEYETQCMKEIRWTTCNKIIKNSKKQWRCFISQQIEYYISKERLDRIFNLICDSKQSHHFKRTYIVMFVHCRIFVVPSILNLNFVSSGSNQSLDYLLSNANRLFIFKSLLLGQCIVDLLEELYPKYGQGGIIDQFIESMLQLLLYNSVLNDYKYEDIIENIFNHFIQDGNPRASLLVAVILCYRKYDDKYFKIITQHLNNVTNTSITEEIQIIYLVSLVIAAENDVDYEFTNMDYTLCYIISHKYRMLPRGDKKKNIELTKKVFSKLFLERFMRFINDGFCTKNQRIFINCFFLMMSFGLIYEEVTSIVHAFEILDSLSENNVFVSRIGEIIMYKLYEYRSYINKSNKKYIINICKKYLQMADASDELKLSSFLSIMHWGRNEIDNETIKEKIDNIYNLMKDDHYLGFSRSEF